MGYSPVIETGWLRDIEYDMEYEVACGILDFMLINLAHLISAQRRLV
jgi:hypothetical protein